MSKQRAIELGEASKKLGYDFTAADWMYGSKKVRQCLIAWTQKKMIFRGRSVNAAAFMPTEDLGPAMPECQRPWVNSSTRPCQKEVWKCAR